MSKKILSDMRDLHVVEWTRIKVDGEAHRGTLVMMARRRIARAFELYVHGDRTIKIQDHVESDGTAVITVTAHPNVIRALARWA